MSTTAMKSFGCNTVKTLSTDLYLNSSIISEQKLLTDFFSGLLQSIIGPTPPSGLGTAPML